VEAGASKAQLNHAEGCTISSWSMALVGHCVPASPVHPAAPDQRRMRSGHSVEAGVMEALGWGICGAHLIAMPCSSRATEASPWDFCASSKMLTKLDRLLPTRLAGLKPKAVM
jgi:hypothetical protein